MSRRVALVRTDDSEERIASTIRVTGVGELETSVATNNRSTPRSSETSILTRATRRHMPEDGILHTHRCINLKS
jgi:hypothetical protein